MRPYKKLVIFAFLILILAGSAWSQKCADVVTYSSVDSIKIDYFKGRPGDTVLMPFRLVNDSIVTVFQFLFKFDTTWLTPIVTIDSSCADWDEVNQICNEYFVDVFINYYITPGNRFYRFVTKEDPFGIPYDSITTKFKAKFAQDIGDPLGGTLENVISCNFLPVGADYDSLPGGDDVIFYIKFKVKETMPHNQLAYFTFFEQDLFVIDSCLEWNTVTGECNIPRFPPETTYVGCYNSQMTSAWRNSSGETVDYQIYPRPKTTPMAFQCDTAYVPVDDPVINSFAAFPSTVTSSGQQVQLSWSAENADSVVLRYGTTRLYMSTNLNSSYNVTLPNYNDGATFTYQLTAYGGSKTAIRSIIVTVDIGGTTNHAPTISFNPSQTTYEINQGETVAFTVTANDIDGNNITLSAPSLPNNATFGPTNPVIGAGTVTGNFSFTPDYNQKNAVVINFTANDGITTTSSAVTIIIKEIKEDRLFSTSAPGQSPVGGLRGTKGIYFPINLITNLESKDVYGVQFDMFYPHRYITVDSFVPTARIPDWVVYDNINDYPGEVRVVTFGLANEPVATDTSSAILYAVVSIDSSATPWTTHWIYLENGRESVSPDPGVGSLKLVTDSGVVEVDNPGDINLDKYIDVGDAVNAVAYIIGNYGLTPRQFAVADITMNDSVNVFDLVGIINYIYGIPIPPMQNQPLPTPPVVITMAYNDIPAGSSDLLTVVSEEIPERLAGVQLEINYDPNTVSLGIPKLTEDNQKFALSYKDNGKGNVKILIYHMAPLKVNELIQPGIANLVDIPLIARKPVISGDISQIRLNKAYLSTSTAARVEVQGVEPTLPSSFVLHQNYPNPFNPTTTIEFTIGMPASGIGTQAVSLDIFNILGQNVKNLVNDVLTPGEYKVQWNGTNRDERKVASGIYLYRLQVGSESDTKKMLLLK